MSDILKEKLIELAGIHMNASSDIKILEQREYLVVKRNDLIQKSRYSLSVPEQRTIAYICSLIKPLGKGENIDDHLVYEFAISDYCKVCGFEYASGKNYADVKATLKKLSDCSMWITFPENPNEEVLCRWLSKVRTNKQSGIAHIELDRDMVPYLFDLREKFTRYQLFNILSMKSGYSIRLYEVFKSYAFQKYKIYDLDDLKRILLVQDVKTYSRFPDFRRTVLDKALSEINSLTDINVTYETINKGRKVTGIKFYIKNKKIGR